VAIAVAALGGAALIFSMFEFQSQLIFPTHAVPRAGPLPKHAEKLSLATPDGQTIAGIHIPAESATKQTTL
jgi:hypothetical protein